RGYGGDGQRDQQDEQRRDSAHCVSLVGDCHVGQSRVQNGTGLTPAVRDTFARYSPPMATTDEPRADSTESKLDQLRELRDEAEHAGTDKAIQRQRPQGKPPARERLVELLDPGSFVELDRYVRHREPNFGMLERRP